MAQVGVAQGAAHPVRIMPCWCRGFLQSVWERWVWKTRASRSAVELSVTGTGSPVVMSRRCPARGHVLAGEGRSVSPLVTAYCSGVSCCLSSSRVFWGSAVGSVSLSCSALCADIRAGAVWPFPSKAGRTAPPGRCRQQRQRQPARAARPAAPVRWLHLHVGSQRFNIFVDVFRLVLGRVAAHHVALLPPETW